MGIDAEAMNVDTTQEVTEEKKLQLDKVALLRRIKGWVKADMSARQKWRKQAELDFAFVASHQWSKEDQDYMKDKGRVPVVFNRVLTTIKSIAGSEINGRLETRYQPRGTEDTKVNELLTAASDWMSDQCDAEDEQSEAFEGALITGEGWTEARMDYDEDPEGLYIEEEFDSREMVPDCKSKKKNYADARRLTRIREISVTEARAMFPDAPDSDLDASWAGNVAPGEQSDPKPIEEKRHQDDDLDDPVTADRSDVTLVHTQWWEKEAYYLVAMLPDPTLAPEQQPLAAEPEELDHEEFKVFEERAKVAGINYRSAKMMRKVYKQAFIGAKVLEYGPTPCPYGFSFNCITGERDRKDNTFFGFVRVMRDPQMWANKMLSNALHIANTTAKGGVIAERDAFEDQRQAEDSYAQPDEITWANKGAVSNQKIMPKPGAGDPSIYLKLLEFAIASIRDVTGVNLELLGLRDANQPGILEAQRKQAAMTVLASIFNSLRRFRKNIGRVRLHFIQEHLSDGRLILIKGEDGDKQAVQLLRERTMGKYDVIVADAPTSPNQKEATWAVIQQFLPIMKDMITPDVMLTLLEYSPLPSDVVEKLRTLKSKAEQEAAAGQKQQSEQSQQMFEAQVRSVMAKAAKDEASAAKAGAEAQTVGSGVEGEQMNLFAKAESERAKGQANLIKAHADADATRMQAETQAHQNMAEAEGSRMRAEADVETRLQAAADKSSIDEATVQRIVAETQKTMMEAFDARLQAILAVKAQEDERSLSEKALQNTDSDLE